MSGCSWTGAARNAIHPGIAAVILPQEPEAFCPLMAEAGRNIEQAPGQGKHKICQRFRRQGPLIHANPEPDKTVFLKRFSPDRSSFFLLSQN
jgi:hypothetical protein